MQQRRQTGVNLEKSTAGWWDGANSGFMAWLLPDTQYQWAVNIVNRGGYIQTRPGYRVRLTLPEGNLQGCIIFKPTKDGTTVGQSLVFAVDGKVYYSPFPLVQPANWEAFRLKNITFSPTAKQVYWAIGEKSVVTASGGTLQIVPTYSVLVMQDGTSQAAYYDGIINEHTDENKLGVPRGTWMTFSGSRLWVARNATVLASDLSDPLTFKERTTISSDFKFLGEITGLANTVGDNRRSNIVVFTGNDSSMLLSSVVDRNEWATTANFQTTLYPNLGCVSGRSITYHSGLLWWYADGGLVSSDSAAANFLSSRIQYKDIELARSKRNLSEDLSMICASSFENYLLVSVPSGDTLNAHTWALDYAVVNDIHRQGQPAWQPIWTGTRPVEWTSGVIDGSRRIFYASVDYQALGGSFNHIWEAFMPDRTDSYETTDAANTTVLVQNPIYCEFETKPLGDGNDFKRFDYAVMDLVEIGGEVNLKVSVAGTNGGYSEILHKKIIATISSEGVANQDVVQMADAGVTFRLQSRRLKTEMAERGSGAENNVESELPNTTSKYHSLLFQWCGRMGIEQVTFYTENMPETSVGTCEKDEDGLNIVTEDGTAFHFEE